MRRSVRDAAERAPERARRHQSPACLGAPQKSPGHDGPGDDAYGGDEGIRTLGLCLAKAALSQLSYIPVLRACCSCTQESVATEHPNDTEHKSQQVHMYCGDSLGMCQRLYE